MPENGLVFVVNGFVSGNLATGFSLVTLSYNDPPNPDCASGACSGKPLDGFLIKPNHATAAIAATAASIKIIFFMHSF